MTCHTAKHNISLFLDGRLPFTERHRLHEHLEECPPCSSVAHQMESQRKALRSIPQRPVPEDLTFALRVTASRAKLDQTHRASIAARIKHWGDHATLFVENLMRPMALPVAGGVLSALFLFSMMSPMYVFGAGQMSADVPTTLTRPATMKSSYGLAYISTDITVDVWIDRDGRLIDYSIPESQTWGQDQELRRSVENYLLLTQFEPARMFGVRKSGKIRITLRHNAVEVKG